MLPIVLDVTPLTANAFAPYGDLIALGGEPDKTINQGMCGRYHDLAKLDFTDGRAGISFFDAKERRLPIVVDMVERHAMGSQAFIPLSGIRFLAIVADDDNGIPVNLRAFVVGGEQSINFHRGIWHGVLTPIGASGRFVVVDRVGDGANLEEHWFETPHVIERL